MRSMKKLLLTMLTLTVVLTVNVYANNAGHRNAVEKYFLALNDHSVTQMLKLFDNDGNVLSDSKGLVSASEFYQNFLVKLLLLKFR